MKFTNLLSDEAALGELGRRLAETRLGRGWTQAQLATAAGVSKRTVERLEAGESTQLGNLMRCLRALERLEALERLLPEAPPSPIDLLERHGRRRRRARARTRQAPTAAGWTWGDER
ncbi:MAG TPA: helix-turn-helix transcriptional regulator [Phenylobacterium sp.]|jgi:transcriptional regulator with XRE-family HTH domain